MTCIESVHHVVLRAIASVEVVRTNGVCLKTDTKELCLKAWLHVGQLLGKDFVEALLKNLAITELLNCEVL